MEAAVERDDDARRGGRGGAGLVLPCPGGAGLHLRPLAGVQARQLDGALVGLGARVREEALPRLRVLGGAVVEQVGEAASHFPTAFDVVVVAHVDELFRLLLQRADDGRMAVP